MLKRHQTNSLFPSSAVSQHWMRWLNLLQPQVWNVGVGKPEVSIFPGVWTGSKPVMHQADFWTCLCWRGFNNLTLDTSSAAAHTKTAMLKGKNTAYEKSHRVCGNQDPLVWRTVREFIWASVIRITCYRAGFAHSMLDGCSYPFEISLDLKSFILGQWETCAERRSTHIILRLQRANCFAISHFHLPSDLILKHPLR